MQAIFKRYAPSVVLGLLCFGAGLLTGGERGKVLAADANAGTKEDYTFISEKIFDRKVTLDIFKDNTNGATLYINETTGMVAAVK